MYICEKYKKMSKILVTGANGQLGKCLKWAVNLKHEYVFVGKDELDITNESDIDTFVHGNDYDFIINCAAYTDVNNCKNDMNAVSVNTIGPMNLAKIANRYNIKLIHISTDYVFNGEKNTPYTEEDEVGPLNFYGISKLLGEEAVLKYKMGYVFRTSWLYSIYGKNFLTTIAKRIKNKQNTDVVIDQIGSPTSARTLAKFLVWFIDNFEEIGIEPGLYHFSNNGLCSWYDFAVAIEDKIKRADYQFGLIKEGIISPITTKEYDKKNNLASEQRPAYSVLSNDKIRKYYPNINHWLIDLAEEIRFLGMNDFWGDVQ